ncbi:hypothetical protein [Methylotenera sp.]|uniref:hypothetical protein n=1 Tax=Methylotenera sp. TaxID=2051956 RepID=UPI002EDA885E
MVSEQMLTEVKKLFCNDASIMVEAGLTYIHFPSLTLPPGNTPGAIEALVCLSTRDGYNTRLFFSEPVAGKGQNWSVHSILGKAWHTCSWNYVEFSGNPTNVIAQHLRAFK